MNKHSHGSTGSSGEPDTFQRDPAGSLGDSSFPAGWLDASLVDPNSEAPHPSAVVIQTTDAHGHGTKALAILPAVADSQGIYRPIDPGDSYATSADVRIDQFGDVDPAVAMEDPNNPGFLFCGCPIGTENLLDFPTSVGLTYLDGGTGDPSHQPGFGILASSQTHTWHLFFGTANVLADIDLGLGVQVGKWYGIETDFNATTGALHGLVTDAATGATLSNRSISVTDPRYGAYNPNVDGVFNVELYIDGEITLAFSNNPALNKPGLAVIDNIDVAAGKQNHSYGFEQDSGWNSRQFEGVSFDRG